MTIRFIITIIVAIFNLILALIIYKKNRGKTKSVLYFILFCIFAFLWSSSVAATFISKNELTYLLFTKLSYLFAAEIFIIFLLFSFEYPYQITKLNKFLTFIVIFLSIIIFYSIVSNWLLIKVEKFPFGFHEIENKIPLLLYGIFLFFILICSYGILIKKYLSAEGINKKRLFIIIIGTSIPFIFGLIFDWYVVYVGRYDLDRNGPLFAIPLDLSIMYLLFKKDN